MRVLVTGSSGLVGSEAVRFYDRLGWEVFGFDNNMRREFFGPAGDTNWTRMRLVRDTDYQAYGNDIRHREKIFCWFDRFRPDLVIHCAAQPSHDRAREIPLIDFDVNALGTLNLLEATRKYCPESAVFIHMSTNKVYGDNPNAVPVRERATRYTYYPDDHPGIDETCSLDYCTHSVFGASKLAADVMAQEYARTYGLKVGVFRGGCITGSAHAGVELHGFLSYLVKAGKNVQPYTIYGYKGKQVRDNLHAYDLVTAFEEFRKKPRPGAVYNIGGGQENSISILEALAELEKFGLRPPTEYCETPRLGDHRCYITDLRRFRRNYPEWTITRSLPDIFEELIGT